MLWYSLTGCHTLQSIAGLKQLTVNESFQLLISQNQPQVINLGRNGESKRFVVDWVGGVLPELRLLFNC